MIVCRLTHYRVRMNGRIRQVGVYGHSVISLYKGTGHRNLQRTHVSSFDRRLSIWYTRSSICIALRAAITSAETTFIL